MIIKKCPRCEGSKPLTEFYKNRTKPDGHSYICIACTNKYSKEHYNINKQSYLKRISKNKATQRKWYKELVSQLECFHCGQNHPATLDFHHEYLEDKRSEVSKLVRGGYSKATVIKEINKCIVLCSNCHRILHSKLREVT